VYRRPVRQVGLSLLTLALSASCASQRAAHPASPVLRVEFTTEATFESRFCPTDLIDASGQVHTDWIQEAVRELPHFQASWDRDGSTLLATTTELFQQPFPRREESVHLHLCRSQHSMATPLLVEYAPFLEGPTGGHPAPKALFIDEVFHELLHRYVVTLVAHWPTPIAARLSGEAQIVRVHLHLMAIQRAVYTRLGRADLIASDQAHIQRIGGPYLRAWSIVNDPAAPGYVGYQALLAELH
jgi:hypothetical protein